jgi:hypothetical protein
MIKVLANLVFDENYLPSLQMATSSLCLHMALLLCTHRASSLRSPPPYIRTLVHSP